MNTYTRLKDELCMCVHICDSLCVCVYACVCIYSKPSLVRRGIPNGGSAIFAFYAQAAFISLVQYLGHSEQDFIDLTSTWALAQDFANPGLVNSSYFARSQASTSQTFGVMNGLHTHICNYYANKYILDQRNSF